MRVTTLYKKPLKIVRIIRKISSLSQHHRRPWYAKEWMTHKGLRQSDIVSRTSFNKGQVSEYMNGKRRWNQDVLEAFADAIGVDWGNLLRPPEAVENELADYVMAMDKKKQARALRVIKAIAEEDTA